VPTTDVKSVTESSKPAGQAQGVKFLREEEGNAVFAVESGSYTFASEWRKAAP